MAKVKRAQKIEAELNRIRKDEMCISSQSHVPPACCAYSNTGSGIPCLDGIAVVCEKHASANLYKLLDKRHLTSSWKEQYSNLTFTLPSQDDVASVSILAKSAVVAGDILNVTKAIAPPRGRPITGTGKRLKGWNERGAAAPKRRCYTCSLCHLEGHTRANCPIRQMFVV